MLNVCRPDWIILDGIDYQGNRIFFNPKEDDLFYEADGWTPVELPHDLEAMIRGNIERYLPAIGTGSETLSAADQQAA